MRRLILSCILLFTCWVGFGQQVPEASANSPEFGYFTPGDSITVHLARLNLIANKGGGSFYCEAVAPQDPAFAVDGVSPSRVAVQSEKYIIKSVAADFKPEAYSTVYAALRKKYGEAVKQPDGRLYWIRGNLGVCFGKYATEKSYCLLLQQL